MCFSVAVSNRESLRRFNSRIRKIITRERDPTHYHIRYVGPVRRLSEMFSQLQQVLIQFAESVYSCGRSVYLHTYLTGCATGPAGTFPFCSILKYSAKSTKRSMVFTVFNERPEPGSVRKLYRVSLAVERLFVRVPLHKFPFGTFVIDMSNESARRRTFRVRTVVYVF